MNKLLNAYDNPHNLSSKETPKRHSSHDKHGPYQDSNPNQSTFFVRLSEITNQLNSKYKRESSQKEKVVPLNNVGHL